MNSYHTMAKAWQQLQAQLPPDVREGVIAMRFEKLISQIGDADPSLRGAIDRDRAVRFRVRMLDAALSDRGRP